MTLPRSLGLAAWIGATAIGGCASRPPAPKPQLVGAQTRVQQAEVHAHGADVPDLARAAGEARRIDGLGDYHRAIATTSPEAQAFFDQGMRLYWGFNHDEAYRSFAKAAALDPQCTLCFWGASLSLGPNYNMPMLEARTNAAWSALERARAVAHASPPVEQALVSALATRYSGPAPVDEETMGRQNHAYARAMREVAKQFVDDTDVQSLFAESLMILNPWKLWAHDGTPATGTQEIVSTLERALAKDPSHPGANHLYVHAVEASPKPGRAVTIADRLRTMMPNAGHLVHMPSHIYQRVGRYEDAAEANRRAIEADTRYATAVAPRTPPNVYETMYVAHNHQFLSISALMEGRSAEAIEAARSGGRISPEAAKAMPMLEFFAALPQIMSMRFGRWSEVLAAPPPDPACPTARGLWHHARGLALTADAKVPEAERELAQLITIARALPPEHPAMQNKASDILAIAALVLEGKLADMRGDTTTAIARLEEAVRREDALSYDEPPNWWYPVRHVLGPILLDANRPLEAEKVYRADLRLHPENGWALAGLAKSLEQEGDKKQAAAVAARAKAAWKHADVPLRGSWL